MNRQVWLGLLASVAAVTIATAPAFAQKKPNVVMLMSDDASVLIGCGPTSFERQSEVHLSELVFHRLRAFLTRL